MRPDAHTVVRTREPARLHRDLYETVTATGVSVDGHHTPAFGFPHVTPWDDALTANALAGAVDELAGGPPLAWTLPVPPLGRLDDAGLSTSIPLGDQRCGRR